MNIVFTFRPPRAIQAELKESFPQVSFFFCKNIEEADLTKAEVLMTLGADLTEETIALSPKLKWIMTGSAGLDDLPLNAIAQKNILLTNARGIHKIPMAEFIIGLMLGHVKKVIELHKLEQTETWPSRNLQLQELAGKHLAVLGTGAIGQEVARLAKAFRMTTTGVNRSGAAAIEFDHIFQVGQLKEAIADADFIVSVLPSTPETFGLLQREHFEAMKQTAVFLNLGRGTLVSEMTLLSAVNDEEIAHAYLDVFAEEPLPEAHPFWRHPNITVTPHISSVTKQYIPRAIDIFKHNLHCFLESGEYQNIVAPEKGY